MESVNIMMLYVIAMVNNMITSCYGDGQFVIAVTVMVMVIIMTSNWDRDGNY